MRYKLTLITAFLMFFISGESFAQIALPPVQGPIVKKVSVFVSDLDAVGGRSGSAEEFSEVVRNDLTNAALFDVSSGGQVSVEAGDINFQAFFDAGAEYLVAGQYRASGGNIEFAVRLFDVVGGKPILGKSYVVSPERVREAAHRFAEQVMKELTGIDGFFTSKIAFVLGDKQNRNLYLMDYDGKNIRQLTSHGSVLMSPNCSPDGDRIIFNSDKVWDQDLYVVTLGSKVREKRLTRAFRLEQSAEWSPNGNKIAYSSNGDIHLSSLGGDASRNITRSRSIDVSPTWSPDGSKIAFVSDRAGVPQIYVMNSDGSGVRRLTSGSYSTDPSWSPSSEVNKIAFVRLQGGEANIFTISPDGSGERRLTSGSGRNETPSWSPDGHYIAFSSTRGGPENVYIMYLNGENQRQLSSGGGKSFPAWCR